MAKRPSRFSRGIVIDFHAHLIVPEVVALATAGGAKGLVPEAAAMARRHVAGLKTKGNRAAGANAGAKMTGVRQRLADMDRMGVDIQVLTASLVHQCTYWSEPKKSLAVERIANDRIAEFVAANPDRLAGLGTVPLQSTPLAVEELQRCMTQLGLKGVNISSTARDRELGDPRMRRFWAKAEELGAAVYIHPAGMPEARYQKNQLWNSLGQPQEEAMAAASLLYGGVMDEFPRLKICIAHGGGYLPFYTGRLDRNYQDKPHTRGGMTKPASAYLRNFHYDSCLYNRDMLEFLVKKVGPGRIVMGSDYPVGESDPVGYVRHAKISADAKRRILGTNAARFLGLKI